MIFSLLFVLSTERSVRHCRLRCITELSPHTDTFKLVSFELWSLTTIKSSFILQDAWKHNCILAINTILINAFINYSMAFFLTFFSTLLLLINFFIIMIVIIYFHVCFDRYMLLSSPIHWCLSIIFVFMFYLLFCFQFSFISLQQTFWHVYGSMIATALIVFFSLPAAVTAGAFRREVAGGQLDSLSTLPGIIISHCIISYQFTLHFIIVLYCMVDWYIISYHITSYLTIMTYCIVSYCITLCCISFCHTTY